MPASNLRVVVTRKLPEPVEARMRALFDVSLNAADAPMNADQIAAAAQDADVLVPTVTDKIGPDLVARFPDRLKLIAQFGAGVDNIDVAAAVGRGIAVTNTPGVLTEDTADLTMALILAVPRRIVDGVRIIDADGFDGWSPTWMMGRRLGGKKLGIIGMGRIGQAVARRARAFNLEIHYHNRRRVSDSIAKELGATYWESLDQMLAAMDIVSVNCPHTPATYHLLSARRLALLKPHAYLVNTARGEIIDEAALAKMLEKGDLAGAGLDVFEHEPSINPKLKRLKNVTLLPHLGSATLESRVEMGERVIVNIQIFATGEKPPNRVIPAML